MPASPGRVPPSLPRFIPRRGIFYFPRSGYAVEMQSLPIPARGQLLLVTGLCDPKPISTLTADLALRGPVSVLDGGNRFAPYRVAHLLRLQTVDVASASRRIFIRRAFTCYQMLALLESTPPLSQPCLVLDLLATFYDDHVQPREAARLLELCITYLGRLRQHAPLVVTLGPPPIAERSFLIDMLSARADQVLAPDLPSPSITQLPLFY